MVCTRQTSLRDSPTNSVCRQWGLIYSVRWLSGKEPSCHCRSPRRCRFDPWVRKIPWGRNDNLLQYSCLENPMDRGAWRGTVHGVPKNWTWLSNWECVHTQSGYTAVFKMLLHSPLLRPWLAVSRRGQQNSNLRSLHHFLKAFPWEENNCTVKRTTTLKN